MKSWPASEARAKFCELIRCTLKEGPQVITRKGEEKVVLVSIHDWWYLNESEKSRRSQPSPSNLFKRADQRRS